MSTNTNLVPHGNSLGESLSELGVAIEDVLQLMKQYVHLGLAEDRRIALLQRLFVVMDQPPERGQVVVLAVDQAVDDVSPLGLLRGQEHWSWRKGWS